MRTDPVVAVAWEGVAIVYGFDAMGSHSPVKQTWRTFGDAFDDTCNFALLERLLVN
jgi:hypothetical protein